MKRPITRRTILKALCCSAAVGLSACTGKRPFASADDRIEPGERGTMAEVALAFMRKFDVPGLSVAVGREGRLVYERAFGTTGHDSSEPLTNANLFRIASVSKPITSAAIFSLVESGRLRMGDTVFGAGGILGTEYGTQPYAGNIEQITVDHLLTHTAGGWQNNEHDPMFLNPEMSHAELISWTLDNQPLKNPPGTAFAYSNFGYCVLGRVIEKVAALPYADYVQRTILFPCDISDMRIGGNTSQERAAGEVTYYAQADGDPYALNVRRMDSHGGWIATAGDLVRFAMHVDGFDAARDILRPATIRSMTTASPVSRRYACGWYVNARGNWWHGGSLPGTTTILVRTSSGFCWAALTNTRRSGSDDALDDMVWEMVRKVSAWRRALA